MNNNRNLRYVNDVIIQYENEAKNEEIKELASENQIVKSKLERNKKPFGTLFQSLEFYQEYWWFLRKKKTPWKMSWAL